MSYQTDKLAEVALRLRNHTPETWELFLAEFENHAREITVAVTNAEQHEILRIQGQAQMCLHLLRIFKECAVPRGKPTPQ